MNQRKTIMDELEKNFLQVNDREIDGLIDLIAKANRIFFFSQGREMIMLSAFAMRVYHMGYDAYVVGEPHAPSIGKGDLLVMSLGMGNSPWTGTSMELIKTAKTAGATVAVFSANPGRVPEKVDYIVYIPGQTMVNEPDAMISIQPLGSAYEHAELITLDYTVKRMMERNNWIESDLSVRHANLE
jgi:6-phospho-3-hexuloisomerase